MGKYDKLNKEELIELLTKRDEERKFGLVWERNQIEHDNALNNDYVFMDFISELSVGKDSYDNLIIEGDNFDALRYLNLTHKGKIKCIYIDPPYNTGNKDFVYNDHYVKEDDAYRHSTWLEFLYRRLLLSRDLLREDGVLFVSINDENRSKLELLLDEIFPGQRIGSMVWRTKDTTNKKDIRFSSTHEHILIYANPLFKFNGIQKTDKKYKNPDNDPLGKWNIDPLTVGADRFERETFFYPLQNPKTERWYPCDPDRVWAYTTEQNPESAARRRDSETMEEWIRQNKIIFPNPDDEKVVIWQTMDELIAAIKNGEVPVTPKKKKPLITLDTPNLEFWLNKQIGFGRPGFKKHWINLKSKVNPLGSWIARVNEEDDEDYIVLRTKGTGEGSDALEAIFRKKVFNNPKPPKLIQQLILQSTSSYESDIILDFFAGSGTTAQSVLESNVLDSGNRKFILVSSKETTINEPKKNICKDICAKRVTTVINGYQGNKAIDSNFAYLRTKRINREDIYVDLQHPQIWSALELIHFDKLTVDSNFKLFYEQNNKFKRIIYLPEVNKASLEALLSLLEKDTISTLIYSWQPGIVNQYIHSEHSSVEQIPDYLIERFGGIV